MVKPIRKDKFFILAILVVGLLLRLDFLFAGNFRIDADEAIVGLMGKHILETGQIPVFYYGQHYMGSLEALVASGVFGLFGVSCAALKLVPLLFSLLLIVLLYLIGLEIGDRKLARMAGVFAAVPPATLVIWSTKARGGFIEVVVIGALAVLVTCRVVRAEAVSKKGLFLIGLILGFGWWVNNQIIYYMLPIGFFLLGHLLHSNRRRIFGGFLCGIFGFFTGGLSFWSYNIQKDFPSFGMFGAAKTEEILEHASGVFNTAFPIILGAKRYWATQDLFPGSSLIIYALYGFLLLLFIIVRRSKVRDLFYLRVDAKQPVELFLLLLFATICVFSVSSFGYLVEAPRYMLPVYVAVIPLSAFALRIIFDFVPLIAKGLAVAVLLLNLYSYFPGKRAIPGEPFVFKQQRVSSDHQELISWLSNNHVEWVRTNYWIGYRLAFETREQVRFLIYGQPGQVRIEDYEKEGKAFGKEKMPLVLVPTQAEYVKTALDLRGYSYKMADLSGYKVLYEILPLEGNLIKLANEELKVAAFDPEGKMMQSSDGPLLGAVDGDLETRWGSGKPQSPGMRFEINLAEPVELRGLRYEVGKWKTDYPRSLRVELLLESGEVKELFPLEHFQAILYTLQGDTALTFYFNPEKVERIILHQEGSHSILDWSIAEIELYL